MRALSDDDFAEVFEYERPRLRRLAYRLLGSVSDADDVLQDAYLRLRGKREQIEHPRAYFERTVTRTALDRLKSAAVRRERYVGPWIPEPLVTDGANDGADPDDLSLALMVLLDRLGGRERAAFVLREALGHSHGEIATILGTTEVNARAAYSRARRKIEHERDAFSTDRAEHRRLVDAFVRAMNAGDAQALMDLLASNVCAETDGGGRVVAAINPVLGVERVARFALGLRARAPEAILRVIEVNGLPSLATYVGEHLQGVTQLGIVGGKIAHIWGIVNPEKLAHVAS